jgi:hypothetical protein
MRDVLIHCDGSHFTLLRPVDNAGTIKCSFSVLKDIIPAALAAGCVVHINEVEINRRDRLSVRATIEALRRGDIRY